MGGIHRNPKARILLTTKNPRSFVYFFNTGFRISLTHSINHRCLSGEIFGHYKSVEILNWCFQVPPVVTCWHLSGFGLIKIRYTWWISSSKTIGCFPDRYLELQPVIFLKLNFVHVYLASVAAGSPRHWPGWQDRSKVRKDDSNGWSWLRSLPPFHSLQVTSHAHRSSPSLLVVVIDRSMTKRMDVNSSTLVATAH